MGVVGSYYLFTDPPLEDPVLGQSPSANHISLWMCGYQLYNLLVMIPYPILVTKEMVLHHIFAMIVSFSCTAPACHGFVHFFFGAGEISSFLLGIMEFFKQVGTIYHDFFIILCIYIM
jgi:hypothetical protein